MFDKEEKLIYFLSGNLVQGEKDVGVVEFLFW